MFKKLLLVALAVMMLGTIAAAQSDPGYYTNDVYWVSYFNNRNNPTGADQLVYIINPGYIGTPLSSNEGTLCANIYVFDATQEMFECCACPITANALLALSVNNSLTSKPLTSVASASGVIKLVSTRPVGTLCDPTTAGPLSPDLRAWATHVQQPVTGSFVTTETPFLPAPLATGGTSVEEGWLAQACGFVQYFGSGTKGICACQ
jgi:hypothetical protein